MLKFDCLPFITLSIRIAELRDAMAGAQLHARMMEGVLRAPVERGFSLNEPDWVRVIEVVRNCIEPCNALNLPMAARSARDLENVMLHWQANNIQPSPDGNGRWVVLNDTDMQNLSHSINELISRYSDELSSKLFLQVDSDKAALYEEAEPPFGIEVVSAFPKAAADIEEASKCLALERFTASVFHLMRAMECSVQALSAKLGINRTEREWGKLLSDMAAKIEEMPRGGERDEWSASHTHLYHVKQAWRNDVMHPRATYTEEEAHEVFRAVRSFMRHLAALV